MYDRCLSSPRPDRKELDAAVLADAVEQMPFNQMRVSSARQLVVSLDGLLFGLLDVRVRYLIGVHHRLGAGVE